MRNTRLVPPQFAGLGEGEATALAMEREVKPILDRMHEKTFGIWHAEEILPAGGEMS